MAGLIDAGGSGGAYARGVVAQAQAAILPEVRRLIDESIGRIAVRAGGNLTAIGIRSALMFDPAATAVVDDPDHEQVIVPLASGGGGSLRRCSALLSNDASLPVANNTVVLVPLDLDEYDPDDWHSTATTTHKITVPEEGDYVIFARFTWENDDSTGSVGTRTFTINGTGPGGFYGASRVDPASSTVSHLHQELTHAVHLTAGTSCWMEVQQNSGGTLQAALASNRRENPRLTVLKVG
jgi:hypothetical protein